jgi:hypothetical protein
MEKVGLVSPTLTTTELALGMLDMYQVLFNQEVSKVAPVLLFAAATLAANPEISILAPISSGLFKLWAAAKVNVIKKLE